MTLAQRASQTQTRVVETNPRPSFTGFPESTLLESSKVPITEIAGLCATVSERIAPFHRTSVPGVGERVVLHHFWVECRTCSTCGTTFEIHPHYQLAYIKEKGLQWVFCKGCHEVAELPITRKENRCGCGTRTRIAQGTLTQGKVQCPACGAVSGLGDRGDAPKRTEWRLFAQEYLEETSTGVTRHFKTATRGDRTRYGRARSLLGDVERAGSIFALGRKRKGPR